MIITKKNSGYTPAPILPDGSYQARIYSVVHIGLTKKNFQGNESLKDMIRITFELPTELYTFSADKGEQPYSISREETASLHEKAGLAKLIAACGINLKEAEAFDIKDLLGKTLMVTIDSYETDKGTYNGIKGYSMVPKGLPVLDAVNEPVFYDCDEPDMDVHHSLPEFLQAKIDEAKRLSGSVINF